VRRSIREPPEPGYVRYNLIEKDGKPVFEQVSERPLTNEGLGHFRRRIKVMQYIGGDQEPAPPK
jgi:hypothetical protein